MKDSPPAYGWSHGNTEKKCRMFRTFQVRNTHLRRGSGGQAASEMCATRLGRGGQREKVGVDASCSLTLGVARLSIPLVRPVPDFKMSVSRLSGYHPGNYVMTQNICWGVKN
jgi:hypothetical protein